MEISEAGCEDGRSMELAEHDEGAQSSDTELSGIAVTVLDC
jgi:hypothetical protein